MLSINSTSFRNPVLLLWRYGPLLGGELPDLLQLSRACPEISSFGRPDRHGPQCASLHRESGAAVEVRLLLGSDFNTDSTRLLTAQRTADREPLLLNLGPSRTRWVSLPLYSTLLLWRLLPTSAPCIMHISRPVGCTPDSATLPWFSQERSRTTLEPRAGLSSTLR